MRKPEHLSLLISYLKMRRVCLVLVGLLALLLAVIFPLYNLPGEPVVYAVILWGSVALIILGIDFWRFRMHHSRLVSLQKVVSLTIENLPPATNLLEGDYQQLIHILRDELNRVSIDAKQNRKDLVEYYTLWAHQIKTPIAAMRLLLQTGDLSGQTGELDAELFKIERYVEMVLQYLRIESPASDFVFRRCDLDSLVRQVVRKYSKIFIRKGIALDFQGLDCEVLTDEKWLAFVLEQILDNALKYTPAGKLSIYLESAYGKTLVIEDTGIGITAEDLPRIFDKGYTGYTGRVDRRASGIGLYLCRLVLNKLSHTISVESTVGLGTKVKLNLETSQIMHE
ncbi:MAG: HAMP domain-containing histidine kinase [Firmicutes bacterium]|nr:HAMP domain-containing histidine kinase [Bacillota bacterium]